MLIFIGELAVFCSSSHAAARINWNLTPISQWTGKKARVDVYRVEPARVVKVGSDYEPFAKSAIIDVVKAKLLEMPEKISVFATEMAWRAIMARKALE